MSQPIPLPKVIQPPPESPPLWTKIMRAKAEIAQWRGQGGGIVSREIRAQRLAQCKACEYYKASGNLMFGECRAPGCGCTRAKLWLASTTCPHPAGAKWGPVVV